MKGPCQPKVNLIDPWPIKSVVPNARYRAGARDTRRGIASRLVDRAVVERVISAGAATCEVGTGAGAGEQSCVGPARIKLHHRADGPVRQKSPLRHIGKT